MMRLIYRWLQGRAGFREERELRRWREEAPENEEAFRELERLWNLTELPDPTPDTFPDFSAGEVIRRAEERQPSRGPDEEGKGVEERRRAWKRARRAPARRWTAAAFRAAALLILGFGLGLLTHLVVNGDSSFFAEEFTTGPGERATVTLSDGGLVHLAPETRLRFLDQEEGRVELEGRAFFAVEPRTEGSFRVVTSHGETEVLGTRFDLEAGPEGLQVVVLQGRVGVTSSRERAEVGSGEVARSAPGSAVTVERTDDVEAYLDWMGRTLIFQATPLGEVVRSVQHRYGKRVELMDTGLAEHTVTAWFSEQEFVDVMQMICRVVGAECEITEEGAWIG